MKPRRRILLAIVVVSALLALGSVAEGIPWSPATSAPGQAAALTHSAVENSSVENWILFGMIVVGFGALTIRMSKPQLRGLKMPFEAPVSYLVA